MPTDIRERLKALVEEWGTGACDASQCRRLATAATLRRCADQLAAILAESGPCCRWMAERTTQAPTLPLGHPFVPAVDVLGRTSKSSSEFCGECGQHRSAHEREASLPLGHPFVAPSAQHVAAGMCLLPDGCHWYTEESALCGQLRSAHEPESSSGPGE